MKRNVILLCTLTVALMLTSCVSQHKTLNQYAPLTPDKVRLELTMQDYEYLGDVTMEVTYKTYFGSVGKILTINGEAYNPRFYRSAQIRWNKDVRVSSVMEKALYKIGDTYPDADYIMPVRQERVYDHMLGGREIRETLTVKVFALKKQTRQEMDANNRQIEEQHQQALRQKEQEKTELQRQLQELQRQLDDANLLLRSQQNSRNARK